MSFKWYLNRLFDFTFEPNENSPKLCINQFHITRKEILEKYLEFFKGCYENNVCPQWALSSCYDMINGKKVDPSKIRSVNNYGFKKRSDVEHYNELRRRQNGRSLLF